ncbi:MAG: C69 family dipeptidase [Deltaproteobacteria bacterium]|nr:C69 family dipeptidase [Deltaproteobacteria bacterium]
MKKALLLLPSIAVASLLSAPARPCTSILVSPGASSDDSTMVTYAADSHHFYGELVLRPAGRNLPGTMADVYEWDSGKRRGQIAAAPTTYSVVGNINEHQLVIAETTYGGREELVDPTAVLDYGTLIYEALKRARTAREAIEVMTGLVAEYGYGSSGESFSIGDPREVWLLEMVGKGPGNKGALWVAVRIPNGYISAHANQSRIRQFALNDSRNVLYAKDVISFARGKGWFKGRDQDFSFADAYAPLDFGALRYCEARVWNVFRRAAPSLGLKSDWVNGDPRAEPLPLWVKPDKKLSAQDVMALMRDHFEGTEFDMRDDVGAGPYALPYRWRPMTWEVDGAKYLHERAISTQQTGWSFVSQSRSRLPDPIGGLLWFGVDDTYSTVYLPIYAGIRSAPPALAPGVATLYRFSWDSAFWVFNWVANFAYSRYRDMILDVQVVQRELEGDFLARQAAVEKAALRLHGQSPELARDYLTEYSTAQTQRAVERWRKLGEDLVVKYLDGNVKSELGEVLHPPYPDAWYRRIVAERGEQLRMRPLPGEPPADKPLPVVGYFHSRDELGDLAKAVPADFDFEVEKLVLLPGEDLCHRPPRCCLSPAESTRSDGVVVAVPRPGKDPCGPPRWLVRLPRGENRPLIKESER